MSCSVMMITLELETVLPHGVYVLEPELKGMHMLKLGASVKVPEI